MPQVKHLGVFQFKSEVTPEEIDSCLSALRGMAGQIPGLEEVLCGPYSSPEGMNDGETPVFAITFQRPVTRDDYPPHPDHAAVKAQ